MKRLILSITLFVVVGLSGCANPARYVVREDTGGIVAIPNNSNAWPSYNRKHAEELMSQHYPEGYEIIREEDTVTGQVTNNTQIKPTLFTGEEQATTNTTTDHTEWRIYYRPKGSSGFSEPIDPNLSPVRGAGRPRGMPIGPRGDMMPSNPQFKPTLNAGN
jgi:hypothetical protein